VTVTGPAGHGPLDPVARVIHLHLSAPSLSDNRSYEARVRQAVGDVLGGPPRIPVEVCRSFPRVLTGAGFNASAVVVDGGAGWEVIELRPAAAPSKPLGLAVDIGTTTLVFHLVDLLSGRTLSTLSIPNPQRSHGADILERILFAEQGGGLGILQSALTEAVAGAIEELAGVQGAAVRDICFVAVSGNTVMCHLLFGLQPEGLRREPYTPVVNLFDMVRCRDIGIHVHPLAWLYCFPNVGSYFGGDLMAGILASGMHRKEEISLLVDVGTNAEVVLGNSDWLVACAGAAGPALEGGTAACGMSAEPGAIDRVSIHRETLAVRYSVIGGHPPKGLCGSGIIDFLAAMFLAGLVDPTGRLVPERDAARMQRIGGEWAYVLVPAAETAHHRPVFLAQSDVKNIIRSKAAMYTILNVATRAVGLGFEDVEHIYVAGAFGNYIDPENAVTVGMLPDVPRERFHGIGNAAGEGAAMALKWRKARDEVERLREKITYLEMNVRGDFMNQLTAAMFLPHTDRSRFPSVAERLALGQGAPSHGEAVPQPEQR